MNWLIKSLSVLSALCCLVAVLVIWGTVGAVDANTIGLGQALLQIGIGAGAGVILLVGRWFLCRQLARIARRESPAATRHAPVTKRGMHTTNKRKAG